MEERKLLKGISIVISLSMSFAYADNVVASNNDISVSVRRDNLIQETLTIKNISTNNISNLNINTDGSFKDLHLMPGSSPCSKVSKQNPLAPNQACTVAVLNTETTFEVKLVPGELTITADDDQPMQLQLNAGAALYAGGTFTGNSGDTQYNYIAYWDGANWLPITQNVVNGVNGNVYTLAYDAVNKCVVVGGAFSQVGQTVANNIARYCGDQAGSAIWQNVGTGTNGPIHAIKFYSTASPAAGYLVGGAFSQAGGINTNNFVYVSVTGANPDGYVDFGGVNFEVDAIDTAFHKSEYFPDIFITGMDAGPPYNGVAQYNFDDESGSSTAFEPVGNGLNGDGMAILAKNFGPTIVSGQFTQAGAVTANSIAQFDFDNNNQWTDPFQFPSKSSKVILNGLKIVQNDMFVTGDFQLPDRTYEIARWDGSKWYSVGGGIHWSVNTQCLTADADNNLYIGGQFKVVGLAVGAKNVAMWDGQKWYRLGSGLPPIVKSLLIAPYLSVSAAN